MAEPEIIQAMGGPQKKFLELSLVDIVFFGGGKGCGKTYALLLEALRHIENPKFATVIFNRTYPHVFNKGGLWDTSEQIYPHAGGRPIKGNGLWKFPSGASVALRHMDEESGHYAWLGSQIPLIEFDEVQDFSKEQFFFMLGCNRSTCGVPSYVRASVTADRALWVYGFLKWWIDEKTGLPIPERSGKVRWFFKNAADVIIWADSAPELNRLYPGCFPKSVSFVSATVMDNEILMKADPSYAGNLSCLGNQYVSGQWKDSRGFWKRMAERFGH